MGMNDAQTTNGGQFLSRSFAHDRGEPCFCTGCRAIKVMRDRNASPDDIAWATRILED